LIGLSITSRHNANWILDTNAFDVGVGKVKKECYGKSLIVLLVLEPTRPAHCQMRAGRMRYHHVPPVAKVTQNVVLDMRTGSLGIEQVARPRIVPTLSEGVTDYTGKLARNKYAHDYTVL